VHTRQETWIAGEKLVTLSGFDSMPAIHPEHPDQARWFVEHVQPLEAALRGYLQARFPDLQDVDDVMQEAYMRLLRAHRTGPIVAVKSFLFVTAKNLALNRLRDRQRECTEPLTERALCGVYDDAQDVPEALARSEELQVLLQAIESLPERCREVVTLRKIYGFSQKEVAAQLGISEHTVEAQTAIAMRKCTEFFRRSGYRPRSSS
jgi:RNA polymerase sigma factor (sigma-70 family)